MLPKNINEIPTILEKGIGSFKISKPNIAETAGLEKKTVCDNFLNFI